MTTLCPLMLILFGLCLIFNVINAQQEVKVDKFIKPYKKLRKWIDCDTCRIGMAWLYKLNDELRMTRGLEYGEYELQNLMEKMCESETTTGGWIKTLDIKYNRTNKYIELMFNDGTHSECNSECKTIELSCKYIIDIKEDDIINFIWDKYNNNIYDGFDNDFIVNICNDTCNLYTKQRKNANLKKESKKYKIGRVGKTVKNALDMDKEQREELGDIIKNVQNLAKERKFQFAATGQDKVYDYRDKDKLSMERRRAQESDDDLLPPRKTKTEL